MEGDDPCRRGLKGGEVVEESSEAAERESTSLDSKDSTQQRAWTRVTKRVEGRGLSWVPWVPWVLCHGCHGRPSLLLTPTGHRGHGRHATGRSRSRRLDAAIFGGVLELGLVGAKVGGS